MRSSHRPSASFTHSLVLMAPWLPQCCTVSPIHAPPRPSRKPDRGPGAAAYSRYEAAAGGAQGAGREAQPRFRCCALLAQSRTGGGQQRVPADCMHAGVVLPHTACMPTRVAEDDCRRALAAGAVRAVLLAAKQLIAHAVPARERAAARAACACGAQARLAAATPSRSRESMGG